MRGFLATVAFLFVSCAPARAAGFCANQLPQTPGVCTASGSSSVVCQGLSNVASGIDDVVSGGFFNNASFGGSVIAGGTSNSVSADGSSVGGGQGNTIIGGFFGFSAIGGGLGNSIDGSNGGHSTIAGGNGNICQAANGTIGGGTSNSILIAGQSSTIAGGASNAAASGAATVGGGQGNTARGTLSTIPGGASNQANANNSFAAGAGAVAGSSGSFVWNSTDTTNGGPGLYVDHGTNTFNVNAPGGVYFDSTTIHAAGGYSQDSGSLNYGPATQYIEDYDTNALALGQTTMISTRGFITVVSSDTANGFNDGSAVEIVPAFGGITLRKYSGSSASLAFFSLGGTADAPTATTAGTQILFISAKGSDGVSDPSQVPSRARIVAEAEENFAPNFGPISMEIVTNGYGAGNATRKTNAVFTSTGPLVLASLNGGGVRQVNPLAWLDVRPSLGYSAISASGGIAATGASGTITAASSVTASAFFGDGSHLAGITGETNYFGPAKTFGSSVTVNGGILSTGTVTASTFNAVGSAYQMHGRTFLDSGSNLSASSGTFTGTVTGLSSMTATAFFGDGSHLSGLAAFDGGVVHNETDFLSSVTFHAAIGNDSGQVDIRSGSGIVQSEIKLYPGSLAVGGGSVTVRAGSGGAASGAGGDVNIQAGPGGIISGVGGNVNLYPGAGPTRGAVVINGGVATIDTYGAIGTSSSVYAAGAFYGDVFANQTSPDDSVNDLVIVNGNSAAGAGGNVFINSGSGPAFDGDIILTAGSGAGATSGGDIIMNPSSPGVFRAGNTFTVDVPGNVATGSSVTASAFFGDGSHLAGIVSYATFGGFSSTLGTGTTFFATTPDAGVRLRRITVTVVIAGIGGAGDTYRCQNAAGVGISVTVSAAATAGTVTTATGSASISSGSQISGLLLTSAAATTPTANVICEYSIP